MSLSSDEQTHLVLEELRLLRQEMNARFDLIHWDFREMLQELAGIELELRGMRLNLVPEVHKDNLEVVGFGDRQRCVMLSSVEEPS